MKDKDGRYARAEQGQKVLLIDDNRGVVDGLNMVLELWGHQVRTALNGTDGIRYALSFEPDVILIDIGLPDLNGYQVVRILRGQPKFQYTLIIALSGYMPGQSELSVISFDHYLLKPPKLEHLKELIERHQQARLYE
jgi:two-component system, OmpR family, response regulator